MTEAADMCTLAHLIGKRGKLPHHSLLHVNFTLDQLSTNYDNTDYQANLHEHSDDENNNEYKSHKYHFKNLQEFVMSSDSWKNGMIQLINIFINCIQRHEIIDNAYTKFCNFFTTEIDHYLKYSDTSTRVRKKYKNYKPYWSGNLNIKWLNMSKCEKNYTKCKGPRLL